MAVKKAEPEHIREVRETIEWARAMGAVEVTVGGVTVKFAGPPKPAPTPVPVLPGTTPDENDVPKDQENAPTREELRAERMLFGSSV